MKVLLASACLAAAIAFGAIVAVWIVAPETGAPDRGAEALRAAIGDLRSRVEALSERVERLDASSAAAPVAVAQRVDAPSLEPAGLDPATSRSAVWYLEQYVASFGIDPLGSEYFRLAVDAHVLELAAAITPLVRDGARPLALRRALVDMLGRPRFADNDDVLDALVAAVRAPSPPSLAARAIDALSRIAARRSLPGLESACVTLRDPGLCERCGTLIVELAGDGANVVLARMYALAVDDTMRGIFVRLLDAADEVAALDVFATIPDAAQPLRVVAAREVADHDDPAIDAFVAQWRQRETDAEVAALLGAVGSALPRAGWSPRQATGAPDADPGRDDPNAWAPRNPEMGVQWLQLTYATPMRVNGVRVFEVNAPGAIAAVRARSADGSWVLLWQGTAGGGGKPVWIGFPLTSFDVRVLRIEVDTDRTPGWNEIDAVELVGPGGSQWAVRAIASSTYASAQAKGIEDVGLRPQVRASLRR